MTKVRKLFRRLRTLLWTAITLLILLAAILVGVGKLLMPYSKQYQPQLEQWLSREFKQRVVVDNFAGEWKAFGPRISLEGVTLMGEGQGVGEIAIHHAALDVKPLNILIPGRPLYSFQIIGADLSLVRTSDGRYELSGLGVSGRGSSQSGSNDSLGRLARVGEVRLEDSSLSFDDASRDIHVQLTGIRGRLQMNGKNLATELEADISDIDRSRVLGDLKATLLLTLGDEQRLASAQWHMKTGELLVSELVQQLPPHALVPLSGWLNAEVWGSWAAGGSQLMEGVIDLRESMLAERPRLMELDHLNTRFRWDFRNRKSWRVDLSDLTIEQGGQEWQTGRMTIERNLAENLGLWVSSDILDLEFPIQLTQRVMSSYNTVWPKSMPRQARGQTTGFDLVLDGRWKLYLAKGQLNAIDAWDWNRYPDVSGIDGILNLEGGEGEATFDGQGVRLDWPRNFRRQAVVDIPACTLDINWGAAWAIDAHHCKINHPSFSLSGRSRFAKSEGKPTMDLNLQIANADLSQLDDYWPQSVMSEKVISWLRRGLVAGTAGNGRFSLRGDMDDWPFPNNEGLLLASAQVSDAELDYQPGWPIARQSDFTASFRNTSMDLNGSIGAIGGAKVDSVQAQVANLKRAVLKMDYESDAPLPALVGFIRATPLMDNLDLDFDRFGFEGPARTRGQLVVPMQSGGGELEVTGNIELLGNTFIEKSADLTFSQLQGTMSYDRQQFSAGQLSAEFSGHPAAVALRSEWNADEVFNALVSGAFPVSDILPARLLETEPMLRSITGTSEWEMELSVAGLKDQPERETWLELRSALAGVNIDLPVPFLKAPEQTWPVTVRYPVKAQQSLLSIDFPGLAQLKFDLTDGLNGASRAIFHLGEGTGELPKAGYLALSGRADHVDMDGWMNLIIDRFSNNTGTGNLQLDKAVLQIGELQFLNRMFNDVGLKLTYPDGVLAGQIESADLSGSIRYSQSDDGSHSLSAQMERIFLPPPVNEGMSMDTDPSRLPELHLFAREFRYNGMDLGEARIEAFPVSNGLRIESLETVSDQLNFQARGDWVQSDEGSRSDFDILLTAESLGDLMSMAEVSSVLEGGQTMLRYDAWWPGPPAAFALARLNGRMEVSVIDGRILNADPGAGRMVGLLSIAALPRRLALDFRDVFGSGFNFDQASGTVILQDGAAVTEDMVLESTAATMAITGSSDLINKEFDYVMAVRPGVSQTLPALGAVIGGPGGAAAGLALQGLLRKSLGNATEATYTIRGPWSAPEVEPVKPIVPEPAEPEVPATENGDT